MLDQLIKKANDGKSGSTISKDQFINLFEKIKSDKL